MAAADTGHHQISLQYGFLRSAISNIVLKNHVQTLSNRIKKRGPKILLIGMEESNKISCKRISLNPLLP